MPFLDEAQPATRPTGGRFLDEEPATPFPGLPQTSDLTDRMADAVSRGYRFYRQSELLKEGTPEAGQEISRLQQEIESIPRGPGIERFQRSKGWRESFQAIADDPVNTIGELVAESMGSLVPKAIQTIPAATALGAGAGFTLGGPAGLATGARGGFIAGTGITSGSLEYSGKILESLQEAGVDIKDPEQLHNAFTNAALMEDVRRKAVRKAVPIAVFDALSAGLAGRFLSRPAASLIGRVGQTGAEVGTQMAMSGIGEAAGEVAAGEKISPPSILAEMLLEPVAGAPEIATGVATRPRATRRIGEPTYATTQREEPIRDIVQRPTPDEERQAAEASRGYRDVAGGPVATQEEAPIPVEPLTPKVAPVQFLQVQEGMPQLVWYKLTGDITSPDGRVYPAGRNISNGELARFGYTVPEVEAKKALPVQVPLPTIGRFELPGTPAEPYETVLQTIRAANADTKAKIQALFPRAEISREQAQSLRNLAFPETSISLWNEIDTSTEPQTISRPEIDALVRTFQDEYPNAPRIVVAENKRDLEVLTGIKLPLNDPAGALVRSPVAGNMVFLVADRMTSADRLKAILAHEAIGHHGVESVMKDDFRALALAVEQKFRNTQQWQDVVERYGARGRAFGNDDQALYGSELLARMAEGDIQDLSLWDQIVAFIRKWWREHVSRTNPISDAEIRKALADARKFLQERQEARPTTTGTSFAEEQSPALTRTEIGRASEYQRGRPEGAMLRAQRQLHNNVLADAIEHIGDLSHRAGEFRGESHNLGASGWIEKVNRFHRLLTNDPRRWSWEREIEDNYSSNALYDLAKRAPNGEALYEQTFSDDPAVRETGRRQWLALTESLRNTPEYTALVEQYKREDAEALRDYVAEHQKQPTLTQAQELGKQAAIALGELDWTRLREAINASKAMVDEYASTQNEDVFLRPKAESPFDRMRRESGAEPPSELTPEQQKAREINERIRGRRPEASFALVDDEGKPTEVFGVQDYITERPVLTPEQLAAGRAHAKTIFDQAGLDVLEDDEMDGWRLVYTGEKQNAAGHKLIDLLTRELATQHQAGKPQLAPLINNVRLNFKYGTMDQLFDLPIRLKLYSLSQGEASRRGMELRALAGLPEDITFVAQNIDVELQHIYSDMFGGKEIQQFLDKTKGATVKKIDKPVQDGVLAGNPEMQQEVDKANAARDPSAKIPNAKQLANEIFKQPFNSFDDLVNALKDRLMKEFKLSDQDATKIARKFKDTFEKPFKDAAQKSYEEVRKALGQIIGSRKGIWDKIQKAINKGVFDNIQVLREVAQAMGMRPPTEEEIKKMKALAAREREMGSLTPKELEEHKKMGTTPEKLQEATEARLAATNIPRSQLRKQMEVLWTRFTKPIPGLSRESWRGFKHTRRNLAAAINEFISANLLFKIGFPSRLGISVFSQWAVNTPTRAIANALVRYHDAIARGQTPTLYRDIAMHLGDSYRAQYNALVPALESARAALLGRGEARNIDRLMSGIAAMDRIAAKAKEYWDAGDYGRGSLLWMLAQIRMGYRVAQSMDNLQGVPAEYAEMRARVINELLGRGMPRAEALNRADFVIGDMKQQHMEAVGDTKKAWDATGTTGSANELSEAAWDLVKQKQYQRIKELGLPADEFREQIRFYRNVLAWNEAEHKGIGGGIARLLQRVEEIAEKKGIPTAITRFSNAIGITINRALAFTPFYKQADYGGYGTSGWFKTETDKQQRRVEFWLGSTVGTAAFMLALSGMWLVRRKWPKDKEEQDLWQQEGHRPGTVEIPVGDGSSFIPLSLNNSPLMFVAPYLAAGGALHDLLVEREAQQKKLNDEAAKTGATPGKIRPMGFGDMALVALEGAKQAIIGGRTPAATLASVTYYGLPNAKKLAASYVSPVVPGLPALQEVSRMAGVALDERFASVWDFMLPLPGSEARRLNMLGDPVKTPNDIQRITQIMTGGNYPLPVDAAEAKSKPAYDALFGSGYRPPSINPAKGYQIGNQYRPMNNSELDKYIELRGRYLKEGLIGTGPYIDKAAAQRVYNDANQRALAEVGVIQPIKTSSTPRTTTTRRTGVRGPRRLRSISRLRRPRLRRLSYRRPRLAVRRPRLRRIRRLAA